MPKITAFEVLTKIEGIRKLTCPPETWGTKVLNIDTIVRTDAALLDLQERLLNDYGSDPQTTVLS